jgi:hypothetical protein
MDAADEPDGPTPFEPTKGLVLHLPFDETSGTIAQDQTARDRDGNLIGAPTWEATGKIGGALRLNGSGQYVVLPRGMLRDLQETTIAAWFLWNGGALWQRLFDFGDGIPTWVYFSPGAANGPRAAMRTAGDPVANLYVDLIITQSVPVGQWMHVAVTWTDREFKVYFDGVVVAVDSSPPLNVRPAALGDTMQNWIGRSQFRGPPDPGPDPDFNGVVDDFRIYDRALSEAHVAALHALR